MPKVSNNLSVSKPLKNDSTNLKKMCDAFSINYQAGCFLYKCGMPSALFRKHKLNDRQ